MPTTTASGQHERCAPLAPRRSLQAQPLVQQPLASSSGGGGGGDCAHLKGPARQTRASAGQAALLGLSPPLGTCGGGGRTATSAPGCGFAGPAAHIIACEAVLCIRKGRLKKDCTCGLRGRRQHSKVCVLPLKHCAILAALGWSPTARPCFDFFAGAPAGSERSPCCWRQPSWNLFLWQRLEGRRRRSGGTCPTGLPCVGATAVEYGFVPPLARPRRTCRQTVNGGSC